MAPPSPPRSPGTPQRPATSSHAPSWHPLLALSERDPGHWELYRPRTEFDQGPPRKYGDIRLVRHDSRLAYRCLVMPPRAERPLDLGLAPTLRAAAELVHLRFVSGHSRRDVGGYPS